MPNRHLETTAATLLSSWTDSDTAMQIVGTSLGLFGPGLLDPTVALGHETPLRNALFDVLLSLVEGGALDLRPTEDAGYAFRWRTDFATAALKPETSRSIDVDAPSPYLAELIQVKRERDDALGRADFAEALAAERERQLRGAEAPRATRPVRRTRLSAAPRAARPDLPDAPDAPDAPDEIDLIALEAEERADAGAEPIVVPHEAAPAAVSAPAETLTAAPPQTVRAAPAPVAPIIEDDLAPEPEPAVEVAADAAVAEPEAAPGPEVLAAPPLETAIVSGLPPEPVIVAVPQPESDAAPATPKKAPAKKAVAKKAPQPKATPKKRAAKKPAAKKPEAPELAIAEEAEVDAPAAELGEPPASEVVYLPAPAPAEDAADESDAPALVASAEDPSARRAKWSGYTLDKPRAHLSSVERIADDG